MKTCLCSERAGQVFLCPDVWLPMGCPVGLGRTGAWSWRNRQLVLDQRSDCSEGGLGRLLCARAYARSVRT